MSVFGEIAKNVGEEVAKGLEKNVAPVVKKAAKKMSNVVEPVVKEDPNNIVWKFEPKPGEVTGSDAINSIGEMNRRVQPSKENLDNVYKFREQINNAMLKKKLIPGAISSDEYASLFNQLEAYNIPREYTGKLANNLVKYYKNNNRKYNFNESLFALENLKQLKTKDQVETFLSLLPEWNNSVDDLIDTAKTL